MFAVAKGLIPGKYILGAGVVGSLNKRLIFPAAKKLATGITTGLGILTDEEAAAQEKIFDDFLSPINDIISDLENEVISILSNVGFQQVSGWFNPKKQDVPAPLPEKKEGALPQIQESTLSKEVGGEQIKKSDLTWERVKEMHDTRREDNIVAVPREERIPKISSMKKAYPALKPEFSAAPMRPVRNIDNTLFTALESGTTSGSINVSAPADTGRNLQSSGQADFSSSVIKIPGRSRRVL